MTKANILLLFILVYLSVSTAQDVEKKYAVHWKNAGCSQNLLPSGKSISLLNFGADTSGIKSSDSSFQKAQLQLKSGDTLLFPEGTFRFHDPLELKDSICYAGQGKRTKLIFALKSASDAILFSGGIEKAIHSISRNLNKGEDHFYYAGSSLKSGDWIQILKNDSDLVTSAWAKYTVKEIVKIINIKNDTVYFFPPLKINYPLNRKPWFVKVIPASEITLKCFSIVREDSTLAQNSNIALNYAVHCILEGVQSTNCNYAHISIDNAAFCNFSKCYFTQSFGYGGGGKGYGIALENGSCENLITDNIFKHLRHSVLFQSGANGNVVSNNFSTDPFWSETGLPTDAAGDIVLHGNYVFSNLIEGNICQNIVIDNSHGINGPDNTFFRNRADLYGIVMNSSPASDSQVFINNEITNTGFLKGLYVLNGTGHRLVGNWVKGTYQSGGSQPLKDSSFYLHSSPSFWPNGWVWPFCGTDNQHNVNSIPAKYRFEMNQLSECLGPVQYASTQALSKPQFVFAIIGNPARNELQILNPTSWTEVEILTAGGKKVMSATIGKNQMNCINTSKLTAGVYFLRLGEQTQKFVITE